MSESPQAVIVSGGMNGDKSRAEARWARYRNEAGSSKGFEETILFEESHWRALAARAAQAHLGFKGIILADARIVYKGARAEAEEKLEDRLVWMKFSSDRISQARVTLNRSWFLSHSQVLKSEYRGRWQLC